MSESSIVINVKETWRVYKWDASVGDNPPVDEALTHPACVEIWEMQDGQPAQLIHKRID